MEYKDIKAYIEGNWNVLKDQMQMLPSEFKEKVEERQKICNVCPSLAEDKSKCMKCGCMYPGLTFSQSKICPEGKWLEIK